MLDDVQQPSLFVGRGSATPQNAQTIALASGHGRIQCQALRANCVSCASYQSSAAHAGISRAVLEYSQTLCSPAVPMLHSIEIKDLILILERRSASRLTR